MPRFDYLNVKSGVPDIGLGPKLSSTTAMPVHLADYFGLNAYITKDVRRSRNIMRYAMSYLTIASHVFITQYVDPLITII